VVERESRIEFDARLVQGQTAAGAIYLFQRGGSEINSMVRVPSSFHEQTIRGVLPRFGLVPRAGARDSALVPRTSQEGKDSSVLEGARR
jgi:hypothetical protein